MALLETPSRLWRRIEADEQNDMPSLPDVPAFEDSNDVNATTTSEESLHPTSSPLQSTPAPPSNQNTIRLQSSESSSTRFAHSIASRASRSGSAFSSSTGSLSKSSRPSISTQRPELSFDDISAIPSYPRHDVVGADEVGVGVGEDGLEDDLSLAQALRSPSDGGSPFPLDGVASNGNSKHSYSVSLRSEPKQGAGYAIRATPLFLIDVINSTARPRFAQPTPHPLRSADPTVSSDEVADPCRRILLARPTAHCCFHGFTPVPRQRTRTMGRLSHPLSRGWTAPGSESEGASFTSTGSSHDLTAHPRANASFDHVMGLGAGGHGVGRFNAGKLNTYLHGLNRRLQEESEGLTGKVDLLRKENTALAEANAALQDEMEQLQQQMFGGGAGSRRSSAGRRVSDIGSTLGEVKEDAVGRVGGGKLEMEAELDAIRADGDRGTIRDKERWRERMAEVERGVGGIIRELEIKVEKAEAVAREESSKKDKNRGELGGKLLEANGKLAKSTAALHDLQSHVQQLEDEIADADQRLQEERMRSEELQGNLRARETRLGDLERKLSGQDANIRESDLELQDAKAYITELEADAGLALDHIEALQQDIQEAHEKASGGDSAAAAIKQESERNAELVAQLEDALDAAEQNMRADADALAELRSRIATLERERERERDRAEKSRNDERNAELEEAEGKEDLQERLKNVKLEVATWNSTPGKFGSASGISPIHRQVLNMTLKTPKTPGAPLRDMSWLSLSPSDPSVAPYIAEIQRLERELGRANESIDEKLDRLENAGFGNVELEVYLNDERARTAALEEDIARLDRREERRLRRLAKAKCPRCRQTVDLRGLNRLGDGDESTLDFSALSHASESTPVKTSESLQDELQAVNRELGSMKRKWLEERQQLLGDNAVLKDAADRLNLEMQDVKERAEKKERKHDKARNGVLGELDEAKQAIADLEEDLKAERTRLRVLTLEQTRAEREKENVLLQLRRNESDMEDVKLQLQRVKRNNNELEGELRANATAEQKAHLLEVKAAENTETIEQLRNERSLLAAEHKKLQQRFKKALEQMDKLREEQRVSQKSHNGRRHALDMQKIEIEELKKALADHADALQATEAAHLRAAAAQAREREQDVVVASLEADLARVRRSAETLGRDLRAERKRREEENARRDAERKAEKGQARKEVGETRKELEKVLRERKQAGAELRLLHERVDLLEGEKRTDSAQLSSLRDEHRRECKGLIVQIHYLKAKFTRESTLRMDLCHQKQYLLILLGRRERSEERVLAVIARITSPTPIPGPSNHRPRRKSLRVVARGVVFIQRIKRASETWRAQCAPRPAIKAALEDVRRRRKKRT
ncbi:hypothetical protein BC826DRAFT_1093036 [Russula brevipes]|nr:hypothetical protein BC826DRAFT_1093036 [Russula brevipes]